MSPPTLDAQPPHFHPTPLSKEFGNLGSESISETSQLVITLSSQAAKRSTASVIGAESRRRQSTLVISQPLNFRNEFVALLLILEELSDTKWGFFRGFGLPSNIPPTSLSESQLEELTDGLTWDFDFEDILLREGIYNMRAWVVDPPAGWKSAVALKIESPPSYHKSEVEVLQVARRKAIGEYEWVLSHLPEILYHEDLDLTVNSPQRGWFEFLNDKDTYQSCALRLFVCEDLRPITRLTAADLAKVFRDIFKCYKWLYEKANILHGNISLDTVMYREKGGEVYGVLDNFDCATSIGNPSPSLKQHTGTEVYMAIDLLYQEGVGVIHDYHHDLESLFYVILILTSHFENGQEIPNPPLEGWFSLDSNSLSYTKTTVIAWPRLPSPTPPYVGFTKWLKPMSCAFSDAMIRAARNKSDTEPLEDHVTFEKMGNILSINVTTE